MPKILFVDLDGTIREPITGQWIQPWDNQQPMPGAKEAVTYFKKAGWHIIGITNQGGVAAGKKSVT
jgi:D-glycero-D-manno-heptose 1,7-bisphosphate phosphatase